MLFHWPVSCSIRTITANVVDATSVFAIVFGTIVIALVAIVVASEIQDIVSQSPRYGRDQPDLLQIVGK